MVTIARMPCYSFANATRFAHKKHWRVIVSSIKFEDEYYCCTNTHSERWVDSAHLLMRCVDHYPPMKHIFIISRTRAYNLLSSITIFFICLAGICAALRRTHTLCFWWFFFYVQSHRSFLSEFALPLLLPLCTSTTMRIDCFYFMEEICLHTENVAVIKCELCWKARALSLSPSCSFITSTSISIPHSHKHTSARQHPVNVKWCCGWRSRQRITLLVFANSIWIEWHIVGRPAVSNTIILTYNIHSYSVLSNNSASRPQRAKQWTTDVMTRAR